MSGEIKPDAYDELVVEARHSIDPEFALVHDLVESVYKELGAQAMKGRLSDDGTPQFSLHIPAENAAAMEAFSNRPA
ncbi:MAG TPA: hypothetical protein VFC50_00900 [Candidatus Dormibacteraeota bacterium]|nr:hypothetical protein [Candidatus Dormibacteraeota bacterium]